jgi:endonuclease/exonuclease/phosphatase family metal-dependent hydrolase
MPERVLRVIASMKADIIGLQEVTYPMHGDESHLSELPGMQALFGPTLLRSNNHYGNVLLTSLPVIRADRIDLSVRSREPRGAIEALLKADRMRIRVIVTHLGLKGFERRPQVEKLLERAVSDLETPLILMGDFNVWFPGSSLLAQINRTMGHLPAVRTYPSWLPALRLDRIWVRPAKLLANVTVHKTRDAAWASDHLPVKAVLRMPSDGPRADNGSHNYE